MQNTLATYQVSNRSTSLIKIDKRRNCCGIRDSITGTEETTRDSVKPWNSTAQTITKASQSTSVIPKLQRMWQSTLQYS